MKIALLKLGRRSGDFFCSRRTARPTLRSTVGGSANGGKNAPLRGAATIRLKFLRIGFGLPTIALVMLALAAVPIGVAADPTLSDSSAKPESRDAPSSPTNQFLTAYNSMALADWLKAKGMRTEATDLYTEALNLFLKVSADYPQWQPAVVAFRINYCRGALGSEERKAESGEREAAKDKGQRTTRDARQATDDGRQMTDNGRRTPDASLPAMLRPALQAGRQPDDGGQKTDDRLKKTTDDRRPATDDGLKRTADDRQRTTDNRRQTTENRKSEISNRKSAIGNQAAAAASPLNVQLQQAALKERGRDYTGALAMYIALLEAYPQEPWALKGACRCCLRLGRMDQARTLTRQALTLPLPDADLNLLAALVDCHDGRYQAAIPLLRQSLKQNSACPEAHVALGVALTAAGQIKEAEEEMKRALSLNPRLGDAYYDLARLSLRQKPSDHDTARVHYQLALRNGAAPDPELDTLLAE